MNFWGKTILENYGKQTKPTPRGIKIKSMKSSLQKEWGGTLVLEMGTGKREVKKSVIRCVHTRQLNAIHFPVSNQHRFLAAFLKEVLMQNLSYQISKHHPKLCLKGCPSSFPRQIDIRQVSDYVIQHSYNIAVKMSAVKYPFFEREYWKSRSNLPYCKESKQKIHKGSMTLESNPSSAP